MTSRQRFLERSITHVSFHNRLTEEDAMWRRREHEREQDRSRSPRQPRRKRRASVSSNDGGKQPETRKDETEGEFDPPLPSNLGINADRWDHAFFQQRYPKEHERQMNKPQRRASTSSDEEKKSKKKHSKHAHRRRQEEKSERKSKRRHRSRS